MFGHYHELLLLENVGAPLSFVFGNKKLLDPLTKIKMPRGRSVFFTHKTKQVKERVQEDIGLKKRKRARVEKMAGTPTREFVMDVGLLLFNPS